MGSLFNLLKGKFKANNENIAVEDDSKLYTEVIYNTLNNFIILISYSNDYFYQMIEFLDACNTAGLKFITMQSSFDSDIEQEESENEEKEFAIRPEKIQHQRQYVILSGAIYNYSGIYHCIDALSNDILLAVQDDLYNNCSSSYFATQIKDGVLDINKFEYKKIAPQYDKQIRVNSKQFDKTFVFNDAAKILSKIPSGFMEKDILQIIRCCTDDDLTYNGSLLKLLQDQWNANRCNAQFMSEFSKMYSSITGELNETKIKRLLFTPKYLLQDDDMFIGDVDDERLDELFRQKYDRFTGLAASVEYQDIDEVVKEVVADGDG